MFIRPVLYSSAIVLLSVLIPCAHAQSQDPPARLVYSELNYKINADGSYTEERLTRLKVLKERGIERSKRAGFSFSTSVQVGEVMKATTIKPDGREIDVSPNNFQFEINRGAEPGKPAYSDRTSVSLIFQDVAVGDTLLLRYRIDTKEPMFRGHFSMTDTFGMDEPFDEAILRYDWPVSLPLKFTVKSCANTEKTAEDRKQLIVTCKNPDPPRSKRRDWSVYEYEDGAGVIISSFPSYAEIAKSYGTRAVPKAFVTTRIQQLADEIVGDVMAKKEQARLLYEWTAEKIGYAGNCVGIGAVVPRDLDWTLNNKLGDCKDHATLLQALLAAKGIASTQALVNASAAYKLATIPTIQAVNHVINYLPDWDLFVDSTSTSTPFGLVPMGLTGKPALLVDGSATKTIPTPPASLNHQSLKSRVKIASDGTATGEASVEVRGSFAIGARESARLMDERNREEMMKSMYNPQDNGGWGKLEEEDPKPLKDTFKYKVAFLTKNFLAPAPAGLGLWTPAPSPANPASMAMSGLQENFAPRFACYGGSSVEEVVFELPAKLKILSVPKGVTFKTPLLSYQSSYLRTGTTIRVTRRIEDRTVGPVCSDAEQKVYNQLAKLVQAEARAQLLYQ